MATDKNTNTEQSVSRIIRERLDQYEVPAEVQAALRQEILAFLARPEKKPSGATVMTPSASMAGDRMRQGHDVDPSDAKPKNV